ncbi:cytochrome P450 [Apiospora hydei]|uniref:Cytochrome P450 n=1 Tax=Apiospora hydei TaxID=1337664 RepID=A0ABR1VJT3_9PEZI
MLYSFPQGSYLQHWLPACISLCLLLIAGRLIYNLWLHPLSHIPGPIWARASGIPSWLHARGGKRHLWLTRQFQIFGPKIRVTPNTVLFLDPEAYAQIYGMKSNVRRSHFYTAFQPKSGEANTLNTVDVAEHAHKRKLLKTCFTEKSVRAASEFITKHQSRLGGRRKGGWSAPINFSDSVDTLVFDIMGDLGFGRSFDIKEPGGANNPLKVIPHTIASYMRFYYPLCRAPFLPLLLWLKPRGLDRVFGLLTPPAVRQYNAFVYDNITRRIQLHREQQQKPDLEKRQDMFHFLCEARDPDTDLPAYTETDLRAESSLLIVAGSDTTSISLSGLFFYLTGDPARLTKLTHEIRTTFPDDSADEIVHGPKLLGYRYLAACIDEGMRLTPTGPSELPREVLPGGIVIKGEYYPPGTIVGTCPWADSRNEDVHEGRDAGSFRPERWIVDLAGTGVSAESVARLRSNFHPFAMGPGSCLGKNLAMMEIMIIVARTLHRLDVRRAPGSNLGGGGPGMGWGAEDERQMQLEDAYVALRQGPEVQFRKRVS